MQPGLCLFVALWETNPGIKPSASHFNRLVDLEEEYATRSRKLVDAYEENIGINQEICQYIRQKIEEHDRTSLVKKMPKMLTSRRLPEILEKYTTK